MTDNPEKDISKVKTIIQENSPAPLHFKKIQTFVRRAGRTTFAQQVAIDTLSDQYIQPFAEQPLDLEKCFGRNRPTILEIGFGMGEASAHIARSRPEENFLCCEVHEPGVGALLKRIRDESISNIRIVNHDAVEVLQRMITPKSLAGVHVFFPDPWHKKRHHKRRLIQSPFIHTLITRLQTDAYIHCATDWQEYAQQMLNVLGDNRMLHNLGEKIDGFAKRPWYRPETKFEKRGLRLGHGVWDILFRAQPNLSDENK